MAKRRIVFCAVQTTVSTSVVCLWARSHQMTIRTRPRRSLQQKARWCSQMFPFLFFVSAFSVLAVIYLCVRFGKTLRGSSMTTACCIQKQGRRFAFANIRRINYAVWRIEWLGFEVSCSPIVVLLRLRKLLLSSSLSGNFVNFDFSTSQCWLKTFWRHWMRSARLHQWFVCVIQTSRLWFIAPVVKADALR